MLLSKAFMTISLAVASALPHNDAITSFLWEKSTNSHAHNPPLTLSFSMVRQQGGATLAL